MKRIRSPKLTFLSSLRILAFFFVFLTSSFCLLSHAAVINVPGDYSTIQAAIDAANDGDEVIVSPGTYYENINFSGKNIILRSTDPASTTVVASTIIDGRSTDSVVTFSGTELTTCVLSGFTITNGYGNRGGGGIRGKGTLATIRNNSISGSRAYDGGGLHNCGGTICNNTISDNWAYRGGGLCWCDGTISNNSITSNSALRGGGVYECHGTVHNNIISHNSAYYDGGGLAKCDAIIQNNTIASNATKSDGGGLSHCIATIQSNIISSNSANNGDGGGLYKCDGTIQDNIISGNSAIGYDFDGYGGGLADCNGVIRNNSITSNSAVWGAGIYGCRDTIQNNIVSGNSATYAGGALCWCWGIIEENVISGNCARYSGGGLCDCSGQMVNNIILNNAAESGGGLSWCKGIITDSTISYNSATGEDGQGGGLHWCSATVRNNSISNNWAERGGAFAYCGGDIQNNKISNNSAKKYGGGFYKCGGTVKNNTISANLASRGGGLDDCYGTILNNTISCNSAQSYGGLYQCRGPIVNCIVWENSASHGGQINKCSTPFYSCIQDWTGGSRGNISTDPRFVDPDNGNFHLRQDSPCIDAGNTFYLCGDYLVDIDGECRVVGAAVDMGSDEFGSSVDSDGDLLGDVNESMRGGDPYNADTDGDGLMDGIEVMRGTHPNVANAPSGIVIPSQYSSIQKGLFLAFPSEEVIVNPGIYHENLHFLGKDLTLRGTDPLNESVVNTTIIDGGALFSVIFFKGTESEAAVVKGVTLRNGCADSGGGINANRAKVTIANNKILDNSTTGTYGRGGGIFWCNGAISNNILSGNSANHGGAFCWCDGIIYNNVIVGNIASRGGGLAICGAIIQENIIMENSAYYGAGIWHCRQTIQNNTVSDNTAEHEGGGLMDCGGTIRNNTISNNSATVGGGVSKCEGIIQNNAILANSAYYNGGGLYHCNGTIEKNFIQDNSANGGGGLYRCNGTIENNIISWNLAFGNHFPDGGGLMYCDGIIQNNTIYGNIAGGIGGGLYKCDGTIRNCIIWANSAPAGNQAYECATLLYCCIQDWAGAGEGNISDDPELTDPAHGDFHLLPSSPCIDAGCFVANLTQDFEGDPRPMDGTVEARGDGSDYDIGADEFTGVVTLKDFNFDLTEEGWGLVEISHFTPPHFDYSPGQLILTAQDNTNTYGFWTSELDAVRVIADCLYRASWTVATDVTDPLAVPNMLLRVNSQNYQQADMLVVSSCGDGSYAPTPEGRTYEMYFVPPESALGKPEDQDDLILSFDIMNFDAGDAPDGSLMLDRVVVEAIPLDTLSTPTMEKTWSFETDSEGWEFGTIPLFTAPLSGVGAGALWLIAQNNINTFGFWGGPSEAVEMEEGELYRLRFTVITDVTVQEDVPQLRLRVSSEDFQSSVVKVISSLTGAEMSATPAGRTYDLYFYPPQSLVGTPQNGFLAAFDILNFDPGDSASGALMLDGVVVESFDLVP